MWSMTSDTSAAGRGPIALLHRVWDARAAGDFSVLEAALAPDATWRGIDDGPWNCESRADIMRVLRQNLTHGLDGRIEETIPYGERIMVAVPTLRGLAQRSPARRRDRLRGGHRARRRNHRDEGLRHPRERGGLRNDGAYLGAARQPCAAARHRDQPTSAARQLPDSAMMRSPAPMHPQNR
jgi:hypothetical protein